MAKPKEEEKIKGIFERPARSGVWWIVYYAEGVRHREKVGRRGDAIKLYQIRKADALRGRKLPELQPSKVVRFADLSAMAVEHAKTHLKTTHDYTWKDRVLREHFGERPADSITPQDIDQFLTGLKLSNATCNRYERTSRWPTGLVLRTARPRSTQVG